MAKINVLMVGNNPSVKGGISSVMSQLLAHDWSADSINMKFIPTYIEANSIIKMAYFIVAYIKILGIMQKERPDLVHIHMSYKGSFFRKYAIHKLCKKNNVPDIIHLHGSEFEKWYKSCNKKKQEKIKKLMRECAAFIVLGKRWKNVIKRIEPKTKTYIIHNSVHIPTEIVKWRKPFNILFMGILIQRKGLKDLLYAFSKMIHKANIRDNEINLIIAGSGPQKFDLKELADKLEISSYVKFIGWVSGDEKEKLFKNCQILVLPSYNEGLPISILEAISFGMPIVATNVGDVSSALWDKENGFIIEPGNIDQLEISMLKLFQDKLMYRRMSRKSKKIAMYDFSDNIFFQKIKNCYYSVLESTLKKS